jgi:hypothetical protein
MTTGTDTLPGQALQHARAIKSRGVTDWIKALSHALRPAGPGQQRAAAL